MTTSSTTESPAPAAEAVDRYAILNACVQCGLCLPTCPTYRETYREQSSPRGRLHLMRSVWDGRLDMLDPTFTDQMSECLDCRACEAACPSGVAYGTVLEIARGELAHARAERDPRSPLERFTRRLLFDWLLMDIGRVRAVGLAARLYQRSGVQRAVRASGLPRRLGLERLEAQLPDLHGRSFIPRDQVYPAIGERRGRVGLLAGCIMHTAFAEVHHATVRVLQRNGWEVVVPAGQGCCGALHAHAGEGDGAATLARRNIAAFEQAGVKFVVNNSAGCGAAMKQYGHLLAGDPEWAARAVALAARVRDVTELLAVEPLRGPVGPLPVTATYQEPCHLAHAQRITAAPRTLLGAIPGLRLVEMAESSLCCGSAGAYSLTEPEMSDRLRERKLANALATDARLIVSANPGCILQLRNGLRLAGRDDIQVRHLVEVLDAAYRAADRDHSGRQPKV